MISTKQRTVEEEIKKNFDGLTDIDKLCIVELYHEFERITHLVEGRAREEISRKTDV